MTHTGHPCAQPGDGPRGPGLRVNRRPEASTGARWGRVLKWSLAKILAYKWAYIFESVTVRPRPIVPGRHLRVRGFVPESRNSLDSSESDSAALAPLLASEGDAADRAYPSAWRSLVVTNILTSVFDNGASTGN
jgi:hypothetical protein